MRNFPTVVGLFAGMIDLLRDEVKRIICPAEEGGTDQKPLWEKAETIDADRAVEPGGGKTEGERPAKGRRLYRSGVSL